MDLCGEAHNDFAVVRDLDGSLVFLFETAPASDEWESGPFYRQHVSELELDRYTEHDQSRMTTAYWSGRTSAHSFGL